SLEGAGPSVPQEPAARGTRRVDAASPGASGRRAYEPPELDEVAGSGLARSRTVGGSDSTKFPLESASASAICTARVGLSLSPSGASGSSARITAPLAGLPRADARPTRTAGL